MEGLFVLSLIGVIAYLTRKNKGHGVMVICKLIVWGILTAFLCAVFLPLGIILGIGFLGSCFSKEKWF